MAFQTALKKYIRHVSLSKEVMDIPDGSVKNPPAMQETRVRSLGQKDPLEMETATHSTPLAGKIPWTEKPGGLQSMGLLEADTT